MMRLAHELAQNGVEAIAFFSTMLPEQALSNADVVSYFRSVRFLCLTCSPEVLTARLTRREPDAAGHQIAAWIAFDSALATAAQRASEATVIDAGGTVDEIEEDVRHWLEAELRRHRATGST